MELIPIGTEVRWNHRPELRAWVKEHHDNALLPYTLDVPLFPYPLVPAGFYDIEVIE